jgi:hypothetical protein
MAPHDTVQDEMAAFLEGAVMMVIASRDDAFRPAIARAQGARLHEGGRLVEVLVSRSQWPEAVGNLGPGRPVALTVCRPTDYRAYQVKGTVEAVAEADAAGRARAAAYRREAGAVLVGLGVEPHQIGHWLRDGDIVSIRFRPRESYAQTPGPGAGGRLAEGAGAPSEPLQAGPAAG